MGRYITTVFTFLISLILSSLWYAPAPAEVSRIVFLRPRWVDHLRSRVGDQPGQHNETPSLLKIQKLAGCGGTHLWSQLLGRLGQVNHLSPVSWAFIELWSYNCIQAWATEWDCLWRKESLLSKLINRVNFSVGILKVRNHWKFCQKLNMSIPVMNSETAEIAHGSCF